jgi:dTDP-4-amino-4,6-dideoxygalactose transaminase
VGRPTVVGRERFLERVGDALDRRWLTNDGPYVRELEDRIAEATGVGHCVTVSSGTAGLVIAVKALGLEGEVVLPSLTFVATAHALTWCGVRPVFADIDPETMNLDPRRVETAVTDETAGILAVHLWGRPADVDGLADVAQRRGLGLLFDAAHAFGCACGGKPVGGFGDAEVLSFHATKFFHTLEGGAIVTDDADLARRARLLRNHGFSGEDRVVALGVNAKMNEICAAMGLTLLEDLDRIVDANRRAYLAYRELLAGLHGIRVVAHDPEERPNYQFVVMEIDPAEAALDRDELRAVLRAENVLARRYFWPGCHAMEPYRTLYPDAGTRLPHTERIAARLLCLPAGSAVDTDQVEGVCAIIGRALESADAVRARLRQAAG